MKTNLLNFILIFVFSTLLLPLNAAAQFPESTNDVEIVSVFSNSDHRADVRIVLSNSDYPAKTCQMDKYAVQRAADAGRAATRQVEDIVLRYNGYTPVKLNVDNLDTATFIELQSMNVNFLTKADFKAAGYAVSAIESNGSSVDVADNDVIAELAVRIWSCDHPKDYFLYIFEGQQVDLKFGPPEWDVAGSRWK